MADTTIVGENVEVIETGTVDHCPAIHVK